MAAVGGATEHRREYRDDAAFVASIRRFCPTGVIGADEAGIELLLDERIVLPTYQFSELMKAGRWPESIWITDYAKASCFVEHTKQLPFDAQLYLGSIVRVHGSFTVYRSFNASVF